MNYSRLDRSFYLSLLVCFIAGAVLVAAFAPLEWAALAFFSPAVLFYCCRELPARKAFWLGLAFGYGQFGLGVSWVYVSLHTYGGMPLWMGAIAVLLFAGILGVFAGLTTFSAARLFPGGGPLRVLALACFWVIYEWLKSWIFTGFAWLELGVTQTPTWLFGFAPIGGVYLVSFAVAIIASCIVLILRYPSKLSPCIVVGITFFLAWYCNNISWSSAIGRPINIGIVQPNVPINQKWQPQYRDNVVTRLMSMSQKLQNSQSLKQTPVELLVWPETALPIYYQQTDKQFWRSIVSSDTALLTGLVDSPGRSESYNAAVLSCGDEQHVYRKRHLVPFGEYLPMRFLFNWVLDFLSLPMADFSPWREQQTLSCQGRINIGLSICYEDAFASEMRQYVGDASLLVNISEDAWFGDSLAPHQRLQMGQMRARELARPMVRSANSGPSAVIDQWGRVLAQTPQFEEHTLAQILQPQTGETPYKRYGNLIVWMSFFLLAIGGALFRRGRPAGSQL